MEMPSTEMAGGGGEGYIFHTVLSGNVRHLYFILNGKETRY
jgi:hypothetical protein